MTTQELKDHAEERIEREYADLAWSVRKQMILAAWASIEAKAWNAHVKANPVK